MTDIEILVDLLDEIIRDVRREIEPLAPEDLAWQPAPQSNSIGVTAWHFSRWLDLLTIRILQNRPPEEEQWHTRGWKAKTGYDPRGIGANGFGAITGYTWEEVQAVPTLSAPELLAYFDQAATALRAHLTVMSTEQLHQPVTGSQRTAYERIRSIMKGCFFHLGEIQALKAIKAQVE